MTAIQKLLIAQAQEIYREIFPCSSYNSFEECFTVYGDTILFWFNTIDRSTHMVSVDLNECGTVLVS